MSAIWSMLQNALAALAAGLGLAKARSDRQNSPEMQRAAQGKSDQEILDAANKASAERDIEAIRKLNS